MSWLTGHTIKIKIKHSDNLGVQKKRTKGVDMLKMRKDAEALHDLDEKLEIERLRKISHALPAAVITEEDKALKRSKREEVFDLK